MAARVARKTPASARKPSRAVSARRPRRKPKKPSRIVAWLRALKEALKRTTVRIFIGITFLSATFPAVTDVMQGQISIWANRAINTQQIQSLMAIPVLGDLLQKASMPAAHASTGPARSRQEPQSKSAKKKHKRVDTIRNPLA